MRCNLPRGSVRAPRSMCSSPSLMTPAPPHQAAIRTLAAAGWAAQIQLRRLPARKRMARAVGLLRPQREVDRRPRDRRRGGCSGTSSRRRRNAIGAHPRESNARGLTCNDRPHPICRTCPSPDCRNFAGPAGGFTNDRPRSHPHSITAPLRRAHSRLSSDTVTLTVTPTVTQGALEARLGHRFTDRYPDRYAGHTRGSTRTICARSSLPRRRKRRHACTHNNNTRLGVFLIAIILLL